MDLDLGILKVLAELGATGLLTWVVGFVQPRERKEVQEAHNKQVDKMLATFSAEMKLERESTEKRHAEDVSIAQNLHQEAAARHEAEMESLKATRHIVRDTHQAVLAHHSLVDYVLGIKRLKDVESGKKPEAGATAP